VFVDPAGEGKPNVGDMVVYVDEAPVNSGWSEPTLVVGAQITTDRIIGMTPPLRVAAPRNRG
jgi:hypothetical protein